MAIFNTIGDLISLAITYAGVIGEGQTASATDANNGLVMCNMILSEWQINRWLNYSLITVSNLSIGTSSYSVGPSSTTFPITGQRPDKLDAVYVSNVNASPQTDTFCYPYMSRESYDRIIDKNKTGLTYSFYYDPAISTNGTLYLYPVPNSNYSIKINCKSNLGQFTSLVSPINLPAPYETALFANLSAKLRPLYGLAPNTQLDATAAATLQTLVSSIAQLPTNVSPSNSNRAGIFSAIGGGST